jgi:hypothetical protein
MGDSGGGAYRSRRVCILATPTFDSFAVDGSANRFSTSGTQRSCAVRSFEVRSVELARPKPRVATTVTAKITTQNCRSRDQPRTPLVLARCHWRTTHCLPVQYRVSKAICRGARPRSALSRCIGHKRSAACRTDRPTINNGRPLLKIGPADLHHSTGATFAVMVRAAARVTSRSSSPFGSWRRHSRVKSRDVVYDVVV